MSKVFVPMTSRQGEIFVMKMDHCDYMKIVGPKMYFKRNRNGGRVYAKQMINGKDYFVHRLIMNAKKGQVVDHINNNSLDNSRSNLRICTLSQNKFNSKKRADSSHKYKGVHKKINRYRATIGCNGKRIHLGSFECENEAARAYNEAAIKYHGEHARLNIIN